MNANPSSANDPNEEAIKKNPYVVNHEMRDRFFSAKLNNLKKDDNRTKFVIDEANMLIAARKYVLKQSNILETAYKNDPDNSEKQTAYENMQQKMHALENVTIAVMQRGYDGGGNKGGRRSKKRSIKRKRRRSSRKGRSSRRN